MPSKTGLRSLTSTLRWSSSMPKTTSPIFNRVRYVVRQITRMSSFCATVAMPLPICTVSVWMKYLPARGIAHNASLNVPSALRLRYPHDLLERPRDGIAVLALNSDVRKPRAISIRSIGLGCGSLSGIILTSIWISHSTMTNRPSALCSNAVGRRPTSASSGRGSAGLRSLSDRVEVVGSGTQHLCSILNPPARPGLEYLENRRLNPSPWRRCGHGMPLRELEKSRTTLMRRESARSPQCPRRLSRPSHSASLSVRALGDLKS